MPLYVREPAAAAAAPLAVVPSSVMDLWSATSGYLPVTATTDSVAHTMGAWTQVVASTSADIDGFCIGLVAANSGNGVDTRTLVDVGIGAAASETVIVAGLDFGYQSISTGAPGRTAMNIPVHIPASSRIAVRAQSTRTTQAISLGFWGALDAAAGVTCPSSLISYGVVSASSAGTTLTAPGGTNAKGAWLELEASTSVDLQALVVMPGFANGTSLATANFLLDVGVGAAASEVVVVNNVSGQSLNSELAGRNANECLFPVAIPAGSRIAARYQRSAVGPMTAIVLGVPA